MKKQWIVAAASLAAGGLCALCAGRIQPMTLLLKGALGFGETLRAWSLSGAAGNAAAWAVCLLLSLIPCLYLLWARRKRRQQSDFLWLAASACLFAGLYVLVNPSLIFSMLPNGIPDGPVAKMAALLPLSAAFSLLLACILLRWAGGLTDGRLIPWMRALLLAAELLTAFSMGFRLTDRCLAGSAALILLTLTDLTPDVFLLALMESARALLAAMRAEWFGKESERLAARTALWGRRSLAAAVCASAAHNALVLLLGRWLGDLSVQISLPLTEMALSLGAMLLARALNAACRLQRDSDLMI